MSTTKKRTSSFVTGLLFVLAIVLLLFSTIGSTRAALNIQSDILDSNFGMLNIGIGLTDGKSEVSGSALLSGMLGEDSKLIPGKLYKNPVSVTNNGTIDEYVRVIIYKYWERKDAEGNWVKDTTLDAKKIDLGYAGGWTLDSAVPSSYGEREIYYYTSAPLAAGDSVPFLTSVKINDSILHTGTKTVSGNTIITTYLYDGARFCIEMEADGVQTHNAQNAILSAWGRKVSVTDGGPINLG